jgi:hypothetical protein
MPEGVDQQKLDLLREEEVQGLKGGVQAWIGGVVCRYFGSKQQLVYL